MVILDVKLRNLLAFDELDLNFSYPKKIVDSSIPHEHLKERANFRYKKLVVLMGANATGKTALGKVLMGIINFISRKELLSITPLIEDKKKDAGFSIDIAFSDYQLYRVEALFRPKKTEEYSINDVTVTVRHTYIRKIDSYETCLKRLLNSDQQAYDNYIEALEHVPLLTWMFNYSEGKFRMLKPDDPKLFGKNLKETLKTLDPRIQDVTQIPDSDNAYTVTYKHTSVIITSDEIVPKGVLSSGTTEGIGVASMITAMKLKSVSFFYCDEKFSHIHSDAEKAFLSLFIELLNADMQLFSLDQCRYEGGRYLMAGHRVKTGVTYYVQLLPQALAVVERYGGELPKVAVQVYNRNLKKIAEATGLSKRLTSHVGRHTFATWALHEGVALERVSKMLGHSRITQTQRYAKVLAEDVYSEFDNRLLTK